MHPAQPINAERLLERFLRYVRVDSAADADADANCYPSSEGQLELGKILTGELLEMGIEDAHQDEHGLVWGTVPATVEGELPTILFNSHVDTSPEAPSANIDPQVIRAYEGGDIPLAKDGRVITVADCPALADLVGHTLVTTDGSTLLGGDDKAGVASIMELAHHLLENPQLPHGPVRVLFTCDEEIGKGASHMDLAKAGALAGYTLDGGGSGVVENENFSADQVTVTAKGYNIHPAIAKDQMVNALRAISKLVAKLPVQELSPERTCEKQGFLHPYDLSGGVAEASCKILLRDFVTENLDSYFEMLEKRAAEVKEEIPGIEFELNRQRQYRNMADALLKMPQVVDFAVKAHETLGSHCKLGSIRGGTDGAVFSEMGLPTPNLSVGQHNIHSVLEFASLNQMVGAIEHAIKLLELWQAHGRS